MLKFLGKSKQSILLGAFFPFSSKNNFDEIEGTEIPKENETSEGLKRVKKMFSVDEFGEVSDEITVVSQTAMLSSLVGFIYGGVINSRTAYMDFLRQNTASTFSSHFEAKRKLQDAVTKSFAKGGWKWCWRICLFSTSFVTISTTISVYKGQSGISEYVIGGALTGAMYKWQMGPRGWLVGGAVGGALGLFAGTMSYGLLKLSGVSMTELRKYQANMGNFRKELIKEGLKRKEEEEDPIIKNIRLKETSSNEGVSYNEL